LWAATLGIAALACNALLGIDDAAPTGDAGDAGGADADPEAGLDARADAGTVDTMLSGPFCPYQLSYLFCEDFDEDAGLTRWNPLQTVSSGGGSVAVSTNESVSPPNSFLGVAGPHPAGGTSGAYIERMVSNPEPDHMTCEFDLRVDVPGKDSAQPFNIAFYDSNSMGQVAVGFNLSNDTLAAGTFASLVESDLTSSAFNLGPGDPIDFTSWQHVSFSYASTPVPSYSLVVTGQPPMNLTAMYTAQFANARVVDIQIGPLCYDSSVASSGWQIYIDNIVCR
jgi:hypothetical protein